MTRIEITMVAVVVACLTTLGASSASAGRNTVVVKVSPPGAGTVVVASSDVGVQCRGERCRFPSNSKFHRFSITPTPNRGFRVTRRSGSCPRNVFVQASFSCTVYFTKIKTKTLVVLAVPSRHGTLAKPVVKGLGSCRRSVGKRDTNYFCTLEPGAAEVRAVAAPKQGYMFMAWRGRGCPGKSKSTVTIANATRLVTCRATFQRRRVVKIGIKISGVHVGPIHLERAKCERVNLGFGSDWSCVMDSGNSVARFRAEPVGPSYVSWSGACQPEPLDAMSIVNPRKSGTCSMRVVNVAWVHVVGPALPTRIRGGFPPYKGKTKSGLHWLHWARIPVALGRQVEISAPHRHRIRCSSSDMNTGLRASVKLSPTKAGENITCVMRRPHTKFMPWEIKPQRPTFVR